MGLQLPKAKVIGKWAFVIAAAVSIYCQHSVCWLPGLSGFIMILRTFLVIFCAVAFEFPLISGLGACGVQRFCGVQIQSWDESIFVKFWFRSTVYLVLSLFWIVFISADSASHQDCKDANGAAVAFFFLTCLCYLSAMFLNESYNPRSDPSPLSLCDCAVAYNIGGDCHSTAGGSTRTATSAVHPETACDFGENDAPPDTHPHTYTHARTNTHTRTLCPDSVHLCICILTPLSHSPPSPPPDDFYTPAPDMQRTLRMFHGTRLDNYESILMCASGAA